MTFVVEVGLPLIIMLAMTIVGLELGPEDLRRVLRYPVHVAVALLGQVFLLPALAAVIIILSRPEPIVAGSLILVATAPQAIVSNFFCLLARADVALAVTLTAVSSLLALVATPLIASLLFEWFLEQQEGFVLPIGKVMEQVVTGLLLPLAAGMLVRSYAPAFVKRNRLRFQRTSLIVLAAFLTIVLAIEGRTILHSLSSTLVAAACFTAGAATLGFGIAAVLSWPRIEMVTMVAAFPARSLSIATLVAINVLGRLEFLSFAVVFFLVQVALVVPVMFLARRETRS